MITVSMLSSLKQVNWKMVTSKGRIPDMIVAGVEYLEKSCAYIPYKCKWAWRYSSNLLYV